MRKTNSEFRIQIRIQIGILIYEVMFDLTELRNSTLYRDRHGDRHGGGNLRPTVRHKEQKVQGVVICGRNPTVHTE